MFSRSTNTVASVVTIHANFPAQPKTSYGSGQEILGQGEWPDRIFQVVRGAVRSFKTLSDGRRQICVFHLQNDIFGWENGPTYRFSGEAIVDTTVRILRRQTLEYVATTDVHVTHDLLSMATKNLEHAENQMMLLGTKELARESRRLSSGNGFRLSGTGVLALPMTRRDIADYLGLTLETDSRELSQLRASGILKFTSTSQRQIMLEDRQKLQSLNSWP